MTRQNDKLRLQAVQQEDTPDGKAFFLQVVQPSFQFGKTVSLIDDPGAGVAQRLFVFNRNRETGRLPNEDPD